MALLEQEPGLASSILRKANINLDGLKRRVEQEVERMPKVSGSGAESDQVYLTGRLNRLLGKAEDEAKKLKDDYVSVEHLLLAMTDDSGAAGRLLKEFGVTRDRLTDGPAGGARQPARHHAEPRSDLRSRSRSMAAI